MVAVFILEMMRTQKLSIRLDGCVRNSNLALKAWRIPWGITGPQSLWGRPKKLCSDMTKG